MLNKGDPVTPDATGVHGVRLATLMYGLPQALRQGTAAHLFSTVKQMHDIFDWPHDRISALSPNSLADGNSGVGDRWPRQPSNGIDPGHRVERSDSKFNMMDNRRCR